MKSLFIRISIVIILILTFSISLTAFLNFFNFNTTYTNLVHSRFEVITDDLKQTIEYNLNLGLGLGQLEFMQKIIKEKKQKDKNIRFFKIISDNGKILFDTNAKKIGDKVPQQWLDKLDLGRQDSAGKYSHFDDENSFIIGQPLINNFNVTVGALLLGYSKEHVVQTMDEMVFQLGSGVSIIVVISMLIVLSGIFFFSRNVRHNFIKMEKSLSDFLAKDLQSDSKESSDLKEDHELEHNLTAFQNKSQDVMIKLNEAEHALRELEKNN